MKTRLISCWLCGWAVLNGAGAGAPTFDEAQLKYNLETTVEAYQKGGKKNAVWDAEAIKILTAFARLRSLKSGASSNDLNTIRVLLPEIMAKGCSDPLLKYLDLRYGTASTASVSNAVPAYRENMTALCRSDYPDIRKFYVTLRAAQVLNEADTTQKEVHDWRRDSARFLAAVLADPLLPEREATQACIYLLDATVNNPADRWNSYEIISSALTNRWTKSSFSHLVRGETFIKRAWEARGNGLSGSVTEIGWKLFGERLVVAAEALETAWKLNPKDLRVCQDMMTVELGQGRGRERMELWFQRGMELQPANYTMCQDKLIYLEPKWYGSAEEMIKFGRECVQSEVWKGNVPLILQHAHVVLSRYAERDLGPQRAPEYWKNPGVWDDVRASFEKFFLLNPGDVSWRHNYADLCYRCGQFAEFNRQIKMFSGGTNYQFFGGQKKFEEMVQTAVRQAK